MPLDIPAQFNLAAYFLDRPAQEHLTRVAILGESAPLTYAELVELANRVGNALQEAGCAPESAR